MLRKILMRLQGPSKLLKEVFSNSQARNIFLGEEKLVSLDPASIRRDASRIVKFAETEDYKAFAQEAWLDVIDSINSLVKPNLPEREVDFHRGALAQTIHLLKVSAKAHYKLQEFKDVKK